MAVVAASGLWIAWYVRQFGSGPANPDRGADLQSYERLLADNYQRQISLLRSVKYWYLLPPYLGFIVVMIGRMIRISAERSPRWFEFMDLVIVTLVFGAVWAANEIYGVRHLRGLQRDLDAVRGREQRDVSG